MAKPLSVKERAEILRLADQGLSHGEIARRIGRSRPTVGRLIARGEVVERGTFKRQINTRMTEKEIEALQKIAEEQSISPSEAVRFLVRNASGVFDIRGTEAQHLRETSRELNALARNLVPLLQLGRSDRLKGQKRDALLVERLAERAELLGRALQRYRGAGHRTASTMLADLPEVAANE